MDKNQTPKEQKGHVRAYHGLTFGVYRLAGRAYSSLRAGFRVKHTDQGADVPHLILCNSQTLLDKLWLRMGFDYPVYCVRTQDTRPDLVQLATDALTAPILQKPCDALWSQECIEEMKKVLDEGGSVGLFPMGQPPYGYAPGEVDKQTVSLIRTLGVPFTLYTVRGGIGAMPRWSDGRRKGPFEGHIGQTVTPEEYGSMTDEQLYTLISRALVQNDKPLALTYKSAHRAEKLERVLYVCPRCRDHSGLYSSGSHVSCRGCGMTANFTETGNFIFLNCETPISTLDGWMDYQISWLRSHVDRLEGDFFTDKGVMIHSVGKTPADEPLFGTLTMSREKLLIRFEDGEAGARSVGFHTEAITSMLPRGAVKLSVSTDRGTWEITGAPDFCAYKYSQVFYALRGQFDHK